MEEYFGVQQSLFTFKILSAKYENNRSSLQTKIKQFSEGSQTDESIDRWMEESNFAGFKFLCYC